jgi:hypothetical protein
MKRDVAVLAAIAGVSAVPRTYMGYEPTKIESYQIAALAFVLSTAFWTAVGRTVSWARRRRRG